MVVMILYRALLHQMGCGLHAGKAVQGAIGSQRKIDPTHISEHVERLETLESLTKRYGLGVLMSDSFYNTLSPDVSRRYRKVDRVILSSDEAEDYCFDDASDTMGLYTGPSRGGCSCSSCNTRRRCAPLLCWASSACGGAFSC